MPRRIAAAALAALLAVSCGDEPPGSTHVLYQASGFDLSRAAEVDALGRHIAEEWDLIAHQGIRGMWAYPDGFFMFFFADQRAREEFEILVLFAISRFGDGPLDVVVSSHHRPGVRTADLDGFVWQFTNALEERFGLAFCRANPETVQCDAEYARLGEKWEAAMRARMPETRRARAGRDVGR